MLVLVASLLSLAGHVAEDVGPVGHRDSAAFRAQNPPSAKV